MDLDTSRDNFLQYLQFEKRVSPHTITSYHTDLDQYFTFLRSSYEIDSIKDTDHTVIRSWVVQLMDQGMNPRSVNRKLTTLKTLYKFLIRQDVIQESPMLKVQGPKTAKRLPVFVEKDAMNVLLDDRSADGAVSAESYDGRLAKLIIEMFYSTGIRLSELIGLKLNSVDQHSCQIK